MQSQFDSVLAQMVKLLVNADIRENTGERNLTPSQEEKEQILKNAGLVLGGTVIEQSETNLQIDGLGDQKLLGMGMEPSFDPNMLRKDEKKIKTKSFF